jgi:hypothetical protein
VKTVLTVLVCSCTFHHQTGTSRGRGSLAKQTTAAALRRNPTAVVEAQAAADARDGFVSPTAVQWVSCISEAAENDRW